MKPYLKLQLWFWMWAAEHVYQLSKWVYAKSRAVHQRGLDLGYWT